MKVIQEGRMAGWYFDLRGVQICWGLAQHRLVELSFLRTINFYSSQVINEQNLGFWI